MPTEQQVWSATALERAVAEQRLREATSTLSDRRAALDRAGRWLEFCAEDGDVVEVADAAKGYQAAVDLVRFYEDRIRRLEAEESRGAAGQAVDTRRL